MSNSKLNKTEVLNNVDFKELSKTCKSQEDLSSLTKEFMKNMIENILKSELEEHLEESEKNSKNGYYKKTVRSDAGSLELDIPRDRACEYEPKLIPKGKRTISGIDEKIISLYARGMSLRDIEKQVNDMYGVEMSDSLISRILDKIAPEMRPLHTLCKRVIYYNHDISC